MINIEEAFLIMRNLGLFACPLNNGDWMVGRASHIYSVNISDDHYKDNHLSIASTLPKAVEKYCEHNL